MLAGSAGCIENMGDLKVALGAVEAPALLAEPTYLPPLARAQANVTSVLTGAPVRFTSEGTRDPQDLPLDYQWSFGDGATARGATVQHAFATAGEHTVRLTVTNGAGLTDVAALSLQVGAAGRRPVACIQLAEPRADAGEALSFDASCSTDPEGQPLSYAWDFGDGATSLDAKATHSFAKPGLHAVKLKVSDPTGLSDVATRVVPVDFAEEQTGAFALTDAASKAHEFPVAAGARTLEVKLTFPGGLGGNDLVLLLKDADGEELARTADTTEPGAQDAQVRLLELTVEDLAKHPAGTWTAEVLKAKGLMVDYTVEIRETF
jgi:chitodextrinase